MNLFAKIKNTVTVKQAAELYGLQPNRNGMCRCLFHDDENPSMKLNERYYYCFACQQHGDVIDLTARIFSLTPGEAAKKLAHDFGISPDPIDAALAQPVYKDPEENVLHCVRVLVDYECLLKEQMDTYSPQTADEDWDPRFGEACIRLPRVIATIDDLFSADPEERIETAAWLLEDGSLARIESYLQKHKEKKVRIDNEQCKNAA